MFSRQTNSLCIHKPAKISEQPIAYNLLANHSPERVRNANQIATVFICYPSAQLISRLLNEDAGEANRFTWSGSSELSRRRNRDSVDSVGVGDFSE